jgi:hypothetical protein
MQAQAATARAHELVRARRIENDRAESVKAGAGQPAPRALAPANGAAESKDVADHTFNRIRGLLDGDMPDIEGATHHGQDNDIPHA